MQNCTCCMRCECCENVNKNIYPRILKQKMNTYFDSVKSQNQTFGILSDCSTVARNLFRNKYGRNTTNYSRPVQYIKSQEDVNEIFELFKQLVNVCQYHYSKEESI